MQSLNSCQVVSVFGNSSRILESPALTAFSLLGLLIRKDFALYICIPTTDLRYVSAEIFRPLVWRSSVAFSFHPSLVLLFGPSSEQRELRFRRHSELASFVALTNLNLDGCPSVPPPTDPPSPFFRIMAAAPSFILGRHIATSRGSVLPMLAPSFSRPVRYSPLRRGPR